VTHLEGGGKGVMQSSFVIRSAFASRRLDLNWLFHIVVNGLVRAQNLLHFEGFELFRCAGKRTKRGNSQRSRSNKRWERKFGEND